MQRQFDSRYRNRQRQRPCGQVLVIEYAVTGDMADGRSLPPFIEDNVAWHVACRGNGRTTWRRLYLAPPPASDRRATPGGQTPTL
jgi:hypothetical protein